MINVDSNKGIVVMNGNIVELCGDTINVLSKFYQLVKRRADEETAYETLALMGSVAVNGMDKTAINKLVDIFGDEAFLKGKNGVD